MKAIDFSSQKVFVKYVDPQKPTTEEVVILVKAALFKLIPFTNGRISVTAVVGTVHLDRGNLKTGTPVAALLPLDREAILPEFLPVSVSNIVALQDNADLFNAILTLESIFRSYFALAILASVSRDQTILILDGAEASNFILLQTASEIGCKVLTTVQTIEDEQFLRCIDQVKIGNVEVSGWKNIEEFVLAETNGFGADVVIDNGIRSLGVENEKWKPDKFEIINCLAPFGKWLLSDCEMQLDPPEAQALFAKSATLSFFNHYTWLLSNYKQGLFLHMFDEAAKKAVKGDVKSPNYEILSLKELESLGTTFNFSDDTLCHVLKMN